MQLFTRIADHLYLRRQQLTIDAQRSGGQALFRPVISSSYASPLEMDYNLHKSNSTFFADLDLNRTELILFLFKDLLAPTGRDGGERKKKKSIALGGVSCVFKRQIAPLEKYDVWSRVLCWDAKWLYVVSHFVQQGAHRPHVTVVGDAKRNDTECPAEFERALFASAISKYVFKAGRVTVVPEAALIEAGLIPAPPAEVGESQGPAGEAGEKGDMQEGIEQRWGWEDTRAECQRGMRVAQNFANLDDLHGTFMGAERAALNI